MKERRGGGGGEGRKKRPKNHFRDGTVEVSTNGEREGKKAKRECWCKKNNVLVFIAGCRCTNCFGFFYFVFCFLKNFAVCGGWLSVVHLIFYKPNKKKNRIIKLFQCKSSKGVCGCVCAKSDKC